MYDKKLPYVRVFLSLSFSLYAFIRFVLFFFFVSGISARFSFWAIWQVRKVCERWKRVAIFGWLCIVCVCVWKWTRLEQSDNVLVLYGGRRMCVYLSRIVGGVEMSRHKGQEVHWRTWTGTVPMAIMAIYIKQCWWYISLVDGSCVWWGTFWFYFLTVPLSLLFRVIVVVDGPVDG